MDESNLRDITLPDRSSSDSFGLNPKIRPIRLIRTLTAQEFEECVDEWAIGYLKEIKGAEEVRLKGGANDKGRDIIVFWNKKNKIWDNYQCKHYDVGVSTADVLLELGKLCYYTFIKDFPCPRKYFFVTPRGLSGPMTDLIDLKPEKINQKLIKEWNNKCKDKITKKIKGGILLTDDFKKYITDFDFSIIQNISPSQFLADLEKTPYFQYTFGLKEWPQRSRELDIPHSIGSDEQTYIKKLLEAYSEYNSEKINSTTELKLKHPTLHKNFTSQRESFFSAEALRAFNKDIAAYDTNYFDDLKDDIYNGITDFMSSENFEDGYKKMCKTVHQAALMPIDACPIKERVFTKDKKGICHHLANDDKLTWKTNEK